MKNYFSKYLPVARKIQIGHKVLLTDDFTEEDGGWTGIFTVTGYDSENDLYDVESLDNNLISGASLEQIKLVELFLCSKDVPKGQSGNRVYHEEFGYGNLHSWALGDNLHIFFDDIDYSESGYDHSNILFSENKTCFVIGRISENAVWVKDGDEFINNDFKIETIDDESIIVDIHPILDYPVYGEKQIVKILCHTCKTYH